MVSLLGLYIPGILMKEMVGNIWEQKDADAICVTTNGIVKANGELVMGKGIALEAKQRCSYLSKRLGQLVTGLGNSVHPIGTEDCIIFSFPTKHHYKDNSDIELIKKSAVELVEWINKMNFKVIYLPRPGCGCGGLNWKDVKKVLEPMLDDRFIVITNENN